MMRSVSHHRQRGMQDGDEECPPGSGDGQGSEQRGAG